MRVRSQHDLWAGLLFIAAGGALAILATGYRAGTAARMGPGYFPFWIGVLLAVVGAILTLRALLPTSETGRLEGFDARSVLTVLGAVVLFGVLLKPLGLLASLFMLVLVSSTASREFEWRSALVNAVFLTALSWVLFIKGLGLSLPVLPAFLGS